MFSTISLDRLNDLRLSPTARLWLIYALFFIAGVAQAVIVPLLPGLSAQYELSASETALLLALPGLATLAVSVPSGLAADRFGAPRVTLVAGALLCLSCLAQAAPSLAALLLGRIIFGVAFGVIWTTGMAWLSDLDDGEGGARLGPSVTCSSVGIMVGPAVGGVLAQATDPGVPFLLIAAVAAVVVMPLMLSEPALARRERGSAGPVAAADESIGSLAAEDQPVALAAEDRPAALMPAEDQPAAPMPAEDQPATEAPAAPAALRSLARQARHPGVGAAAGALVVSGAVSGVSQLLISAGLHHDGISSGRIGLAFSAAAVCYIAVSVAVVRLGERARTLRFNALATAILSVALVPALASGQASALVGALLLTAMPRAAVSTIAYSLASGSDEGGDGSAFGIVNGAWAAAMVLMPLLAGMVEERGGARAAYLAVILPAVAVAVLLVARSRAVRSRPAYGS